MAPKRPLRKAWATPPIEEAEAAEITTAKSAANAETPFLKNGS